MSCLVDNIVLIALHCVEICKVCMCMCVHVVYIYCMDLIWKSLLFII